VSTQEFNAKGIRRKDAVEKMPKLLASLRPVPFALEIPLSFESANTFVTVSNAK